MNTQKGIHPLNNSMTLENRLLFLRIGISIVGTLILLFLMIFIFGHSLQSRATPPDATSRVVKVASLEKGVGIPGVKPVQMFIM